jgi:hypothetical protein
MKTAICILGMVLVLAACSPPIAQPSPSPADVSPLPTPAPPLSPLPTSTPPPSPVETSADVTDKPSQPAAGIALVLGRSGGFAGTSEQWTVYTDGRVEASDGGRWQVAPEKIAQLVAEIERLGFFELAGRYVPLDTCCDRFTYELSVRSGERTHTITALEAAPNAPVALWDILGTANDFIAEATGQ